ncbi:MAG: asparagine synthase (glutamine-hydrolyzing) [Anaerolineae bacterium]|nr:MAG: asparagine synthase (glutamine-hydrolyzing) [Anaerolineae bacterium]
MCGICGMASSGRAPVDEAALRGMNACIAHRGPDGDGFYVRPGVGLAMRRLAIIDVAGGDQPIANEDQTLWIVYNGECYNFPEMIRGLEGRGHSFRTRTDTECILHLYEDHGDDCVTHLRGMFAFALWDEKRGRLLAARDRLGKKPFYYSVQDGTLYFASELPALLSALPRRPEIDLQAIDDYLSLQYIPEPSTPYHGIFKLPAAHRLTWQDGVLRIERYWDVSYEPKHTAPLPDLMAELRHLLTEAVRMRLLSEVPLGAHLSGGIDSSIIVALMAGLMGKPVKTFSAGFEETNFSELPHARRVAERYGADHHEFTLTFGDILATLAEVTRHIGEPFADPSALPLLHLSRLTREHVTVALNGDGGDEAFAGYWRYWLDPWADAYLKLPGALTRGLLPAALRRLPDRGEQPVGGSLINGLKRLETLAQIDPRASLLRWGSYFSPVQKQALWTADAQHTLDLRRAETLQSAAWQAAPARHRLDRTLYADNATYLPGDLLVKADRMTMAASLEGRSPFLDHELAAWAARLPVQYKLRGRTGKWILRETFKDLLPPEILARGKQGFGIPVAAWLRGPLHNWARDRLLDSRGPLSGWFDSAALVRLLEEHRRGRADHGKRLYALVMLAEWKQQVNL